MVWVKVIIIIKVRGPLSSRQGKENGHGYKKSKLTLVNKKQTVSVFQFQCFVDPSSSIHGLCGYIKMPHYLCLCSQEG